MRKAFWYVFQTSFSLGRHFSAGKTMPNTGLSQCGREANRYKKQAIAKGRYR